MECINKIVDIFAKECNYKKVNDISDVKLRNKKNGIKLQDAIYYRFKYAEKNVTKQEITSSINLLNNTSFARNNIDGKEKNISLEFYKSLFSKIIKVHNKYVPKSKDLIVVAVDGTYNNDNNRNIMLNLGIFDVSNQIPISVEFNGIGNRNKEIKVFIQYIKKNIDNFKNAIFVFDRLYHNYELLKFLESNSLYYIVRLKKSGENLDSNIPIKKGISNYDILNFLRQKVRVIRCKKSYTKTVSTSKSKKIISTASIKVKNDCTVATNLLDVKKYTDNIILNYYNSRWDIEVFFKYLKSIFKFSYLNEKNQIQYKKLYICELILTYIANIIENYYWNTKKQNNTTIKQKITITKRNGNKVKCTEKINKSNLLNGIFNSLLYDIINNNINKDKIDNFCKTYIIVIKNAVNRTFPRSSKTPFTKWYIKAYSEATKFTKIISAITENTVDKLNKNLKMIAKKILSIDNKNVSINK
jgi:hypothetical protein